MTDVRTLAIRVVRYPGESLDSWLEALARRSWTSLSALLRALGMPEVPARERTRYLVTSLPGSVLRRLEGQAALPAHLLDDAILPDGLFGRRSPAWRFCPRCLDDSDGRWPARWWLPWTFACTIHRALMHRTCPGCHREPRYFLPRPVHLYPAGHCVQRAGSKARCGTDLRSPALLKLADDHPILQAQARVDAIPVNRLTEADPILANIDGMLSELIGSFPAADLQVMSDACRSTWESMVKDITSPQSALSDWRLNERRARILTPAYLQREYIEAGKSLDAIAQEVKLPAAHVIRHTRSLGFTIYRGPRPHIFNDDWLREQYLVRQRTTDDIARETGSHGNVVRRRLERLGVPRRPSGHSSRALITKLDESLPPDVQAAAEGTLHGWLRLRRFQISMSFPTLSCTATHLGITVGTLSMQLKAVERAIGAELFHRSSPFAPQRPTRRGAVLLRDLARADVQELINNALGRKIEAMPSCDRVYSAATAYLVGRTELTDLQSTPDPNGEPRVPPSLLLLLQCFHDEPGLEHSLADLQPATGIPRTTIFKRLKRLKAAGWLASRPETPEERQRPGQHRVYYSLTDPARRALSDLT